MTVLDAIAAAGGLQQFAKANKIYVLRTGPNGQTQRIKVQYKNILKGKHGADNLVLQTRDTVVVP
jgi:protein involved in polysaccharide export with SLBB domain